MRSKQWAYPIILKQVETNKIVHHRQQKGQRRQSAVSAGFCSFVIWFPQYIHSREVFSSPNISCFDYLTSYDSCTSQSLFFQTYTYTNMEMAVSLQIDQFTNLFSQGKLNQNDNEYEHDIYFQYVSPENKLFSSLHLLFVAYCH